jgi:hypothetical protein
MSEVLLNLQAKIRQTESLETPVVQQVQPTFRTPSQVAFNPALVGEIVGK